LSSLLDYTVCFTAFVKHHVPAGSEALLHIGGFGDIQAGKGWEWDVELRLCFGAKHGFHDLTAAHGRRDDNGAFKGVGVQVVASGIGVIIQHSLLYVNMAEI